MTLASSAAGDGDSLGAGRVGWEQAIGSPLMRGLAVVYLYFFPLTAAFALHRWLPLSLAVLLGALAIWVCRLLLGVELLRFIWTPSDLCLALFLSLVCLSAFVNADHLVQKHSNHLAALTLVLALYFVFARHLLSYLAAATLNRHLLASFLLFSAAGLLDFLDGNFLHLGIRDLIRYPAGYSVGADAGVFLRAKGLMVEPGYYGWYLNSIGLLVLGAFATRWWSLLLAAWYLISLGLTVSTTAFIFLAVAVGVGAFVAVVWGVLYLWRAGAAGPMRRGRGPVVALLAGAAIVGGLWLGLRGNRLDDARAVELLVGETLSGRLRLEASSAEDRTVRYRRALAQFGEAPFFGRGLGDTSAGGDESGLISFYLTLLAECGLPALLAFVAFLAFLLLPVLRPPPRRALLAPRLGLIMAFVAAAGHFALVTGYSESWPWLVFAITSFACSEATFEY